MTGTKTAQIATGLDAWNRVVSLTSLGETVHCAYAPDGRFAAGSNGAFAVEYLYANIYDALERRVRKVAPAETRTFFYGGWNVLNEDIAYTNGTTATIRYVWGKDLSGTLQGAGGVGGLLATQVGGAWYFPAYDANGNVTQYVDEDGHVVASYTYDAFGNTVAESGAMADAFPFRFSTKYYDSESGLYYYGYRFYSPRLGRWLTRDPIEERGGMNLYGFCGNDGVGKVDVLGLVADVVDVIATIRTAEASHPKPPCSNCVYVFFYDREKKNWWHTNEDNNWISHVAISTGITNNIVGFNHEEVRGKQIYSETRKDIALIVRICGYSATDFTAIDDFIRTRVGCATYDGKSWKTYGPNCAVFVSDALSDGGVLRNSGGKKIKWDVNFFGKGKAPRPEELRRALSTLPGAETIYRAPDWKGKESNTK